MIFKKKRINKQISRDYGSGNVLVWELDDGTKTYNPEIQGLEVRFSGKNNTCYVYGSKTIFTNSLIIFNGDDSTFSIDNQTQKVDPGFAINNLVVFMNKGANVKIGKNFTCGGCDIVADNRGADIEIGDDCMFSKEIVIRSTDGHTITENSKKINPGKPVRIGNHCWFGMRCAVLKGVTIPDNCIVSFGAVVLSSLSAQVGNIIAGVPAKVVKSGVNWTRDNYDDFQ
ncbi:MAG: acyltransferase [Deltaproteobacteria bacterium]|jgi:acetyltransferase-like isoleucine patch superfamily enzyme|nr:acyltransferase [Deltaproteobacteria bacterium]